MRVKLFRLNRPDTEWIEKAVQEDVKRGQLVKGSSEWGFPAFPTKENPAYKAIRRSRRMVVDYRELNKVTVRKFFLIPSRYLSKTILRLPLCHYRHHLCLSKWPQKSNFQRTELLLKS